jgi:integrase
MYSKSTKSQKGKASKGSVQIKTSNGRLQLVFSYAGRRHYLSLGFADTPQTRKFAEKRAREIELDILSGNFDSTLGKYKPQSSLSTDAPEETKEELQPLLDQLWEKFLEYKRPQCSPSTMRMQYRTFSGYLRDLPTLDLEQAVEIRDHILQNVPLNSAKRFIVRLSACCDWAIKSGLISDNPFKGMASEIKLPKAASGSGMDDINPFTAEERDTILEAFEKDTACPKYSRVKHSYYYSYIFFLFNTGCRPSEAVALQWKHIAADFRYVLFEQAVVESENGAVCKTGLKTQERRKFPCNVKLRQFLESTKPKDCQPEGLIFPSPTGKWIDSNNFRNRIWRPVLEKMGIEYRKCYQTRHTFITLALEHGLDAKDVARLVGNSPEVIYKHYAGNKRDLFVPEF